MPRTLVAEVFDASKLAKVAGFCCGDERWAKYASEWIQAPATANRGALPSKDRWGNKVWLYFDDAIGDQVVAFGSIGPAQWPEYPDPVTIIPQMAIQTPFHGQPQGAGETPYSHQLLDDLIGRALLETPGILVLTVDDQNVKAQRLYRTFGFTELPNRSPMGHIKMALKLREP